MRIIAFVNPMGGQGKTTLAVNLAACLAEMGKRVLLVDMDAQASATHALGLAEEPGGSLYSALVDGTSPENLACRTRLPNLFVIRSHRELLEMEMSAMQRDQNLNRLQVIMAELRALPDFEFVLLDCPPQVGVMTTAAMNAADELLVPIFWGFMMLAGLDCLLGQMQQVIDSGSNPGLHVGGIVMNGFVGDAVQLNKAAHEMNTRLEPRLSGSVTYTTVIPWSIALGEAASYGLTILEYEQDGFPARAFRDLAREFVDRHNSEATSKAIS
jgi:chromosome partitioning protein